MTIEAAPHARVAGKPDISVIMPVYNAEHLLPRVLSPLLDMRRSGEILEIIVVDDQSTDSSVAAAEKLGARVLLSKNRAGPGAARNIGAAQADGDILWFVDSDVVVLPDGAARIRAGMAEEGVVSVFGSYDDNPPARNFASQYKNLVHHYYHQQGRREASTFWAGCGAIRKSAFLEADGFDVERYKRPSIEDIELGYRLRARGGRILLLHGLNCTHLKRWTMRDVVFTDVFRRAIPWARLMLAGHGLTNDLNASAAERIRAVLAGVLLLGILVAIVEPSLVWIAAVFLVGAFAANWKFFDFLSGRKGPLFAVSGLLFHQFYYLYASAAFAWCWLEARLGLVGRSAAGK